MKTLYKLALLAGCALLPSDFLMGNNLALGTNSGGYVTAAGVENSGGNCKSACPRCGKQPPGGQQRPWSLFGNCCCLNELGIHVGGYLQQSVNTESRNPTNPPAGAGNFPGGGFFYRNDEYMFNRLQLSVDRPTNTGGCGWDIGGHVDLLYGTDYVFLQARGLETHGDMSPKWNASAGSGFGGVGLMGLAIPQLYTEVAYNDLTVKLGHFYHPLGFFGFDPVKGILGNANTYTLFYDSILPVTGGQAKWKMGDRLTIGGGFHRGNANWEDNNNELNGFGSVTWRFRDGESWVEYVFDVGAEDDAGVNQQYLQSIVLKWKLREQLTYVLQSHYGHVENAVPGGGGDDFYSVVNRLAYEINEKWIVGAQYEWFDDTNGTRVWPSPGPGVWHELAFGANYKYCPNIWLRPQIRWDRFEADPGVGPGPWGDSTKRNRFIASLSLFTFF